MKGLGIFKFRDDGSNPAFLNTYAVIVTYFLISVFYVIQFRSLTPEQQQDWKYSLNLLIDAYGVSTITYVLGVVAQNFATIKKGSSLFSTNLWLLFLCIAYFVFYALFVPRLYGLNIFLALFTVGIVLYASHCVFKIAESGQAKHNSMDYRGIT